jgi:hypothetical protein
LNLSKIAVKSIGNQAQSAKILFFGFRPPFDGDLVSKIKYAAKGLGLRSRK